MEALERAVDGIVRADRGVALVMTDDRPVSGTSLLGVSSLRSGLRPTAGGPRLRYSARSFSSLLKLSWKKVCCATLCVVCPSVKCEFSPLVCFLGLLDDMVSRWALGPACTPCRRLCKAPSQHEPPDTRASPLAPRVVPSRRPSSAPTGF